MKIRIEGLSKYYRDAENQLVVLDNLNYSFPEKGSIAIIGRSGVGKSTLLHILGGLDRANQGKIFFDDQDISSFNNDKLSAFRGSQVGFIFQFHHLLPEFSAVENVSMPLIINGVAEDKALVRACSLLERVGLGDRLEHRPGELSGGEQQRVAIARAVVTEPRVVLADEPTGNLDLKTAQLAQELLLELNRELNNLLIVVTHSPDLAAKMDLVVEMQSGGCFVDAIQS